MKFLNELVRTVMSTNKLCQPKWYVPEPAKSRPVLKLFNSLTREKDVFIPKSGTKLVSWYSCGPTVYDSAHMGHARNYVSIDINRRIMIDYFGYNVKFVQNVTDIDDKIIIGARQNYLLEKYMKRNTSTESVPEVRRSIEEYIIKNFQKVSVELKPTASLKEFEEWLKSVNTEEEKTKNPKFPMHVTAVFKALKALDQDGQENFYGNVKEVLMPYLDRKEGSLISDPEIFRKLPAFWENKFDEDMRKLNVLPPSITTRVSEYVPEIVEFVSKIIENGYAYSTEDGSVYFDTGKFDKSEKHDYAKNQPWNKGHMDLIKEGEGSLSSNVGGKKSASDFALWKGSKPGEPRWESPWGLGRPGWHIECSVMASDVLGECMDIHSGGIDLAFPHHDNELAQSEACFDNEQWVNYFLHTGHLHIEGQKMSKSLKNFITIEEALSQYTPRQLRLAFASAQWNNQLDFKESLLNEVKNLESTFNNFFNKVRALHEEAKSEYHASKKLGNKERELLKALETCEEKVDIAFCDNLATPQAVKALTELVSLTNSYISDIGRRLKIEPLVDVTRYVSRILGVIGIPMRPDGLGWVNEGKVDVNNIDEVIMPYVKCLSKFRGEVRKLAINKQDYQEFLELTDSLRDEDLLNLNVVLDDRNGQAALIKLITDEEKFMLVEEREKEATLKKEKEARNVEKKREREAKEQERLAKAKIRPQDMFKDESLYSEWDSDGIPLKDKEGIDISKSMTKRLKKQWIQQEKVYNSAKDE